nr:hypothetical protein [Entomohabitans teleogrylli]
MARLSFGGFFEPYALFQAGDISTVLVAEQAFHAGSEGIFGLADQATFTCAAFPGLFIDASVLMVMLSVGIFSPKTRGVSQENI